MRVGFFLRVVLLSFFLASGTGVVLAQMPGATPEDNPTGDTGALKAQIQTGGSYDAHSGNGTRMVNDLRSPGGLGVYGLDFTRYWNSLHRDADEYYAEWPVDFGSTGWTHSWRWKAEYHGYTELPADQAEEIAHTMIMITFPDGKVMTYRIVRGNRPHGFPPEQMYPDFRVGAPYTVPERTYGWTYAGPGGHDRILMDENGTYFRLCLADGGSVLFEKYAPNKYRATEVYDPNGLRYDLGYLEEDHLDRVTQEGGRFLQLTWDYRGGFPKKVIVAVDSGGPAESQHVDYNYSTLSIPAGNFLTLTSVTYLNERGPGQSVNATYTYGGCFGAEGCSVEGRSTFPLLKRADDPHYAGAMKTIRYRYSGTAVAGCIVDPSQPPWLQPDFYQPEPYSIAAEKSDNNTLVSGFAINCLDGTRREDNGVGGWRMFYFGQSAGTYEPPSSPAAGWCRSYQLGKVTDFTADSYMTEAVPRRRQNFFWGDPRNIWDARNNRTQQFTAFGGDTDEPGEVIYLDGHREINDRVNPGDSVAVDSSRIHNTFHHWLFSRSNELNQTVTYTRDERRRVIKITYPEQSYETFEYNHLNLVTHHRLASGTFKHYDYNGRGLLWREWNDVDGPDNYIEYDYDLLDRVKSVSHPWSRAKGATYSVWLTYNGRHQVTQEQYPPTNGEANPRFKTYEYDTYGNCTAITDEMGHISRYYYDSFGRCTKYTEPLNAPDGFGNNVSVREWDWVYDRYIPGIGLKPANAHTSKSWRVQVEPAYNHLGDRPMTHRAHDVNDQILLEETGWIQPGNQPLGNWQPGPQVETSYFTYDENGQKSTFTDPRGRRTRYEYDPRNRLWKTHETENTVERITETHYDPRGNKTLVKFPDDTTQKWEEYDSFGQAWRFVDERNNTTNLQYIWGPMKKLYVVTTHRLKDDGGWEHQPTYFSYDLMGKPTRIDFPDSTFEKTEYQNQQVWKSTARNGHYKTFDYDARGREVSHYWNDPATPGVGRTWDAANRLTCIWNSVATIYFGYDDASQILSENEFVTGAGGFAQTTYRRYGNGRPWQIWYPNGMQVARAYRPQGQLDTVWDNGPSAWRTVINYHYHQDGKIQNADYGNGTTSAYDYDGRGMINAIHHKRTATGQNLSYRDYYRDSRDRIYAWKKSTDNSVNPMEDGRGDRYEYDPEGQLTRAAYGVPNPANSFDGFQAEDRFYGSWNGNWLGYDALGNRGGWNWQEMSGWTYYDRRGNGLNQYLSWSPSIIYYDDNFPPPWNGPRGNGAMMADGWITASYNSLNQPISIWSPANPGAVYTHFGFDPLGRCVKRWVGPGDGSAPNGVTYLYYDGWNLIQEGPAAGIASRLYMHGARVDEIVKQITPSNGAERFFHYDARTHCTLQTDASANIVEQYSYNAFGTPHFYNVAGTEISYSQSTGYRFLFTGREWLNDLKLYDYRKRLYQPELGRFLQPDPTHFSGGDYNLYRYCHNDPINRTDPTGEFGWPGAAVGALGGIVSEILIQGGEHMLEDKPFFEDIDYGAVGVSGMIGAGTGTIGYGVLVQGTRATKAGHRVYHLRKVLADRKAAQAAGKHRNAEKTARMQQEAAEKAKETATATAKGGLGPLLKRLFEKLMPSSKEDGEEKKKEEGK